MTINDPIERHTNPTPRTRQPRAARTRTALLAAAAAKFDTAGYALASINDILATAEMTKGAMYFHFASKEEIAQQLIADWSDEINRIFPVAEPHESAVQRLTDGFRSLAQTLETDSRLRAGMKLSLEPSIDGAHQAYRQLVDTTNNLIERLIAAGEIADTDTNHRLAWNICAGFTGAIQATAVLPDDIALATHINDTITAQLSAALRH